MTPETHDARRRALAPGFLLALAVLAAPALAPLAAQADTPHGGRAGTPHVARADGAVEIGSGTPPV